MPEQTRSVPVLVLRAIDNAERERSTVVAEGFIDEGPTKPRFTLLFADEDRLPQGALKLPPSDAMPDGQPIAMGTGWVYPLAYGRVARWGHVLTVGDNERRARRVAAALLWWSSRKGAGHG